MNLRSFLVAAVLALVACGNTKVEVPGDIGLTPAESTDFASIATRALSCSAGNIAWTIQESVNVGFTSPRDGSISTTGLYTAPVCGSVYVGTVQHLVATGCSASVTFNISIAQELLLSERAAYAIVNPGTANACLAQNPANVVNIPIGGTVQPYEALVYTCQTLYVPALPSPLPPTCTNN